MRTVELNGKPAVIIEARPLLWGNTSKAQLYKVGESEIWIPKSVHKFVPFPRSKQPGIEHYKEGKMPAEPTGELAIHKWYYETKIHKS